MLSDESENNPASNWLTEEQNVDNVKVPYHLNDTDRKGGGLSGYPDVMRYTIPYLLTLRPELGDDSFLTSADNSSLKTLPIHRDADDSLFAEDSRPSWVAKRVANRGADRGAGREAGRGRGGAESFILSSVRNKETRKEYNPSLGRKTFGRGKLNIESFEDLESLLTETADDLCQFLVRLGCDKSKFNDLLKKSYPLPKQTRTLLNVLIKVANSEVMTEVRMRILTSSVDSVFITSSLPQYFTNYEYELTEEQFAKKAFEDAAVLAENLFEICPTKALTSLAVYLKTWIAKVPPSLKDGPAQERVLALQQECATLKQKYEHLPPPVRDKRILRDFENQRPPPNDYRGLTIYPSYDDLDINAEESFIRSNIIKGPYKDGTHYLDVQFRLIKEDFVKPLRDGIRQYVSAVMNNSLKSLKNLDIKLYQNVNLVLPWLCEKNGIVYGVWFDASDFGYVNWETTKRLMYGSLVCFSADDFESILLATVIDTVKVKDDRIIINVKPVRASEQFDVTSTYVMVESPSHYETCQHALEGLQSLNPAKIPLSEHIVRVQEGIVRPEYLQRNDVWDFSPLLNCSRDKTQFEAVGVNGPFPTPEQMGLDSAQHRALIMTLFRRMSIIQGPPGTGKTFIGYKIVQMLLHNKSLWYHNSPILVVCYTNHALDQFLEGILATRITDKLVRIGGQSKCEALKAYNLTSLRDTAKSERSAAEYLRQHLGSLFRRLRELQLSSDSLMFTSKVFNNQFTSTLLNEASLKQFVYPPHYYQLEEHLYHSTGWVAVSRKMASMKTVLRRWLMLDEGTNQDEHAVTQYKKVDGADFYSHEEEDDADLVIDERHRRWVDVDFEEREKPYERHSSGEVEDYIQKILAKETANLKDVFHSEEESQILDIWELPLGQRWKLYRTWLSGYRASYVQKIEQIQEEFISTFNELQEVQAKMDSELVKTADVVGMTTTGAAKFHKLIELIEPRIVIVEEAAEIMEAQIIAALPVTTQHLILIGDHKQLRPNPTVYDLARKHHLDISLFERMIKNNVKSEQLVKQHRMSPRIRGGAFLPLKLAAFRSSGLWPVLLDSSKTTTECSSHFLVVNPSVWIKFLTQF